MKYFKKLVGERIYLSPRSIEDAEKYTEWLNDFETTDYLGKSQRIMTLEAEKKHLEEIPNGDIVFAIIDSNNDELIGGLGLHSINHFKRTATLGIFIGNKDYREKGYGTEAIRLLLDYGFNYLNLKNINLELMAFNERALACYKKCGFKECGRRRQCEFVDGKYYDRISMDILDEEFTGRYIRNRNI